MVASKIRGEMHISPVENISVNESDISQNMLEPLDQKNMAISDLLEYSDADEGKSIQPPNEFDSHQMIDYL